MKVIHLYWFEHLLEIMLQYVLEGLKNDTFDK